jgi:hypothetical protein
MIQGAGLCYGATRKVLVPIGFTSRFGRRRLVALIAIAAMLAQTLVAGFASAHSATPPANPPTDNGAVICHHGGSSGEPADTPDTGKARPDCCVFYTASAVAIVRQPMLLLFVPLAETAAPPFSRSVIVIARTIIRAGRSQAPPRIA